MIQAKLDKILALARFLTHELRREPSAEELAAELGIGAEVVDAVLHVARSRLDLDDPVARRLDALLHDAEAIVSPLDVGRWFAPKDPERKGVVVVAGPLQGFAGDVVDEDADTVRVALLLFGRPEIVELSAEDLEVEPGAAREGVRRWARQSFERSIAAKLVMFWEEGSQLEPAERYRAAAHLRRELEDRAGPEIDAFAAELSDAMTARPDEAIESTFMRHGARWQPREEEASEVFMALFTDHRRWLTLDATLATCARAAGVDRRARAEPTDGEQARTLLATLQRWEDATSLLRTAHMRILRRRVRRPVRRA